MRETAILLALAILSVVVPVFRLPPPSGPYAVGTVTLPPDQPGGLALQVWYPAVPTKGAPVEPYASAGPGVRLWLLRRVGTGSFTDAPPRDQPARLPVLLSVPGWGGHRWDTTALNQDLASNGYLVAASDLPHGVVDGVNLDAALDMSSPEIYLQTQRLADAKLAVQVRNTRAVLDRLLALAEDKNSRFFGRLDPDRIGIVGFSFGGATAAEAAREDPRIRAAVNLDGLVFGEAARDGVPKPYLEMSDDYTEPTEDERRRMTVAERTAAAISDNDVQRLEANMARHGGWFVTVLRARHQNFADYPLFVPFRRLTDAGLIDPWLAARIVAGWARGFFGHVFDGARMPDADSFPATRVLVWPRPAAKPASAVTPSAIPDATPAPVPQ